MCKEGFDVPTLNTLVIATPRPDVDQIVGRILRIERSKRIVHPLILDIVDPQFRGQFQQRLAVQEAVVYDREDVTRLTPDALLPPIQLLLHVFQRTRYV